MIANHAPEEVFIFPASFAQQRLWFLHQLAPENPFYNVSAALRLRGNLHPAALEQTFQIIGQRHEVLRTTFAMVEGELVQIINPSFVASLPVVDLRGVPTSDRLQTAQKMAQEVAQQPFDLMTGSLFRVQLLQLGAADYLLLLNLHHIVADGWSIAVLLREISLVYAVCLEDQPSPLPDLPIQYADFAHWQREYLQGEVLETQLSYWRHQLQDLPALQLPSDRLRPAVPSYRGAAQHLALSAELSATLERLSDRAGVSLFMTLLAAFQVLLSRYTGQTDIVVGSAIANRNRTELENLIGFFVNSLVLRTDLSGNPTFWQLLERVRQTTLAAYAHQDLPFEKLVEELQPGRDLSRNPLFQVVLTLQNTPVERLELPELTLSYFPLDTETVRVDLEIHVYQERDRLKCTAIYSTDLFESATLSRLLRHFQTLLESIVAQPDQPIAQIPILSPTERHQLLVAWNQTQTPYPSHLCAHQWFAAQAEATPESVALVYQYQQLTYRELDQRANQLAHYLQQQGVESDVLVGLWLDRSPEMVIGLLAIWKAGGAYVPLDPAYPRDRLQWMLQDAQVRVLLTQRSHLEQLEEITQAKNLQSRSGLSIAINSEGTGKSQAIRVICLDQDGEVVAQQPQTAPPSSISADHLAYVIYTSGSTGQPKGVLVEHRGLSNVIKVQRQLFDPQPGSRVLQFASLSFDASLFEILMALSHGATLYLAPQVSLLPGLDLIKFLRRHAITHATLPPSILSVLPPNFLPDLKILIAAGEACSNQIVQRWAPGRRFFNAYGPTEATIWATVAELTAASTVENTKPPIGHPIANTQIYILDADRQPVPVGVIGELYIAGVGIARGYLNRPDLTAERFISISLLSPGRLVHLYKTGDRARYLPDGRIEYWGRADTQVKLRGFRVELGEVEALLQQHPAVQTAVAIARQDKLAEQHLVAYIVPHAQQSITGSQLREFLRSRLPAYLMPSAFVLLADLPLTPNGKIDRAALPLPELTNPRQQTAIAAPRTLAEAKLAKIWSAVLNLEQVSVYDNFFALGGDSFLALRLMEKVRQEFQQSLPLSTLFLAPTVEQLAQQLSRLSSPGSPPGSPSASPLPSLAWSPLVPLQPAGTKPPFFCVHPVMGVVLPYTELARQLGTDQPFYGLQPLGLDGQHLPLTTIEEMARDYIAAIRVVQPQGPYYLGGWSFGGLVAFEMAQQLRQAGHEVALLALLDTLAPLPSYQPSLGESLRFLITTVLRSLPSFGWDYVHLLMTPIVAAAKTGQSPLKHILPKLAIATAKTGKKADIGAGSLPPHAKLRLLKELALSPMLRIFWANSRAAQRYVPQVYAGSITLFKSAHPQSQAWQDRALGWNSLATTEVKTHVLAGNHFSILKQPHVKVLAEQLCCYFKSV